MPFANFNVDSYLPCGSRLKNEVNTFSSVSPPCLFSLIAFEIRCIGRLLLVLSSRLKERGKHARFPLFVLHVYFHGLLLKFGVLAGYC